MSTASPGAPKVVRVPVFNPSWAPDGQRLVGTAGEGTWISIYDLRTRETRVIYEDEGAGSPTLYSPAWAPNGKDIAMASAFAGNYDVVFFNVVRGHIRNEPGIAGGQSPSWSPDGRLLAYDTNTRERPLERSSIYIARRDGSQRRLIVRNGHSPDWSPDGKLLAFVRMVTRTNSEIFVVNVNGTGIRRLTHLAGSEAAPDWQPLPR